MSGPAAAGRATALVIWGLLALFCLRVAGQLVQLAFELPFLPRFEVWQSGALPYPVLVAAQLAIVALVARFAWQLQRGRVAPRRSLGALLLAAGALYFAVMAARLALGLTVMAGHPWIGKPVPAFFHLVLAGIVLAAGRYHWRLGQGPEA